MAISEACKAMSVLLPLLIMKLNWSAFSGCSIAQNAKFEKPINYRFDNTALYYVV